VTDQGTIDDLFAGAEVRRQPRRDKPRLVRTVSLLAFGAVLTAITVVGLKLAELEAPVLAVFAISLMIVGIWRYWLRFVPGARIRQVGRSPDPVEQVPDGLRMVLARWVESLEVAQSDAKRFNRVMLPQLGELADERLRLKHGVTRASDPARAREILGDPLWTFVTMPQRKAPAPRDLDQVITALEKL
jgi:hypothetical protein